MLFAGMLLILPATAQQLTPTPVTKGSAEGTLTVTATVVSSVGLVVGPDGEQRMVVANAADPRDNVSTLQPIIKVQLTTVASNGETHKPVKKKKSGN
jgi:hypothetical protein